MTLTQQKFNDLERDIDDTGKALNTKAIITPRFGDKFKSLPLAVQEVIETGGFEPFKTEVQLLASIPVLTKKAAKALDTKKIWLWENGAWTDTGLSELDLAKEFAIENLDEKVGRSSVKDIIPLVVDSNKKIPIWLNKGKLSFAGIHPDSAKQVADEIRIGLIKGTSIIPLVVDQNGKIPVWLNNGKLEFAGITQEAVNLIASLISLPVPDIKTAIKTSTDGRTLTEWRAKSAKLKTGQQTQLSIVITGDSWTEYTPIPAALTSLLREDYGTAGTGWINIGAWQNQIDDVAVSKTGTWSIFDISATTALPQYGCGPDGQTAISSTIGSKINVTNIKFGDQLTIFYGNSGGAFSYKLNANDAVNITSNTTNDSVEQVTISGLSGTNSLSIEVLSGTVAIHGFHLRKTTGFGVEVNKVGNSGATGEDYTRVSPLYQQKYSSLLAPDVVFIILGTNDYRLGKSVASYKSSITKIIEGYRSIKPNCAVILLAPARSNASELTPLIKFRDAVFELAQELSGEYYNMYDDWNSYIAEKNNGMWVDDLHVTNAGAYRIAKRVYNLFLGD